MRTLHSLAALAALAAAVPAQSSITTLFTGGNGGSAGWMNFFDINANVGISVTAFDLNISSTAGTQGTIDVYITAPGGTYVGNQLNAAAWTLTTSSGTITSAGPNQPSNAVLNAPIVLPPGNHGIAILYNGLSMSYTNGNGTNQTYSNPDLTLNLGSAVAGLFTGTFFDPRVWNGTVYYFTGSSFATATPYGAGCGAGQPGSFYELFDGTNPTDLANSAGLTAIWTGDGYVLMPGAPAIVMPGVASDLGLADDGAASFGLPFAFPYIEGATNTVWVGSNGYVSLEAITSSDFTESVAELLAGEPRIAVYWDDFNPAAGSGVGSVHAEVDASNPGIVHITWNGISEYPAAGSNTFQLSLHQNGNFELKYGAMSSLDGLVGYSKGGNVADPGGIDLSGLVNPLPLGNDRDPLELVSVARPVIGQTATVQTENIPVNSPAGFVLWSFGRTPGNGISLAPIQMPGCFLHVTADVAAGFAPTGPTHQHSLAIPANPGLAGANFYVQTAVIAVGVNPLGVISSNGIEWKLDLQ